MSTSKYTVVFFPQSWSCASIIKKKKLGTVWAWRSQRVRPISCLFNYLSVCPPSWTFRTSYNKSGSIKLKLLRAIRSFEMFWVHWSVASLTRVVCLYFTTKIKESLMCPYWISQPANNESLKIDYVAESTIYRERKVPGWKPGRHGEIIRTDGWGWPKIRSIC